MLRALPALEWSSSILQAALNSDCIAPSRAMLRTSLHFFSTICKLLYMYISPKLNLAQTQKLKIFRLLPQPLNWYSLEIRWIFRLTCCCKNCYNMVNIKIADIYTATARSPISKLWQSVMLTRRDFTVPRMRMDWQMSLSDRSKYSCINYFTNEC